MTPTDMQYIADHLRSCVSNRKVPTWAALQSAYEEIYRLRREIERASTDRAGTGPSKEEIAQAICKAAGWDWKDDATLNAGFMSCASAVLALSPKGSSEPSYPHQPGSPLFDGADAYEAHLADEAAQAMDNGRNTGGKSYLRHGITLPTSVDAVRLALCLRTPCNYPDCGCEHSIHSIVRVLAGGEPVAGEFNKEMDEIGAWVRSLPSDDDIRRAALEAERDAIANEARRYASHYPQSSDGRNTFILLAEWIEARASSEPTLTCPPEADIGSLAAIGDADQYMVGEYAADYTMPTATELAQPTGDEESDRDSLRDALSQLIGWVEECGSGHEGREFALTEARAALKNLRLVQGRERA